MRSDPGVGRSQRHRSLDRQLYGDCSLHGDVAIRAALERLLGEDSKPDMARTEGLLAHYRPHRTLAAAHLCSSLSP